MRRKPDRFLTLLILLLVGPMWLAPAGAGMCFSLRAGGDDASAVCCGGDEGSACCDCCESTPRPDPMRPGTPHDCGCCIDVPIPHEPWLPKLCVESARVLKVVLDDSRTGAIVIAADDEQGQRWALPPPDRPVDDDATVLGLKSVRLII